MLSHDEITARQREIKDGLTKLDAAAPGRRFDDKQRTEWNTLNEEYDGLERDRLRQRANLRRLEAIKDPRNMESATPAASLRTDSRLDYNERHRDALRAVDEMHTGGEIPEAGALRLDDAIRADKVGHQSAYVAAASSPQYRSAFRKVLEHGAHAGNLLSDREREALHLAADASRALGLSAGAGGYAIPIQLDPTVIPTSSGSLNPLRQIARVELAVGNHWKGVTSSGVTAAFAAEGTEASDNSPTLGSPDIYPEKAQSFVPFSIEVGQDWIAIEQELVRMFTDAKDLVEAEKFITGLGHASSEPEGLLVGGTAVVTTSATATIGVGDIYAVKEALAPRWQPRASWLAAPAYVDKVRRLTGPGNTTEMPVYTDGPPVQILRKQAYEHSGMTTAATSGASAITYGDFSQFLVVDRVGMQVEVVSHLFGTASGYPTGQRGFYCWWRTSSQCLNQAAFKTLKLL